MRVKSVLWLILFVVVLAVFFWCVSSVKEGFVSKAQKDAVWNKGAPIPGLDPNKYREDALWNKISYDSYGKKTSTGWEVDHVIPKSRGGSNSLSNLQPLQTKANRTKSNNWYLA